MGKKDREQSLWESQANWRPIKRDRGVIFESAEIGFSGGKIRIKTGSKECGQSPNVKGRRI